MSQIDLVARYLKRYHSITSMFAFRRFSVTRLADIVHKLRRRGTEITTQLIAHKGTRYARYRLAK